MGWLSAMIQKLLEQCPHLSSRYASGCRDVRPRMSRMNIPRLHSADTIRLTDRIGGALVGHGDTEIAYALRAWVRHGRLSGLEDDTLLIPQERVSDSYFLRLAKGNGTLWRPASLQVAGRDAA